MVSYLNLSDDLEDKLSSAEPGDPVASETELAREYRVSRLTARAALQELERRHLVRRIQGRGTFVLRRLDYRVAADGPASFTEIITQAGGHPSTTVEGIERRAATAAERRTLGLAGRAKVVELARRRWIDGEPVGLGISVVPLDVMPDLTDYLEEHPSSLYRIMVDRYNLKPKRAWWRFEIQPASDEVARQLDLRSRVDLYFTQGRLDSARLKKPIEMNDGWLRTDLFNMVVEVGSFQ